MAHNFVDLTGLIFGRLTVISRAPTVNKKTRWLCRCECGNEKIIGATNLQTSNTTSCGCLHSEITSKVLSKRQTTHDHAYTPTYRSWQSMLQRCTNKKSPNYHLYGGRGIIVCKRWERFANFLADMGDRPRNRTLDRFPDVDGNYEPGNCRWATLKQQNRNKRANRKLTFRGATRCVSEWAEHVGLHDGLILRRLKRGWSIEKTLTTPIDARKSHSIKSKQSKASTLRLLRASNHLSGKLPPLLIDRRQQE